ncbi:MAG: hypothetical protein WC444_03060 [Candidatus Paceibacterota bacterium]
MNLLAAVKDTDFAKSADGEYSPKRDSKNPQVGHVDLFNATEYIIPTVFS